MKGRLVRDQSGASTELGYIFTFLLGVLFLSMFSVWAFGLETSTRENWNTTAVDVNMADIAAAVEALFDADVEKVNVRNTKNGKLASVKLAEGYHADEAAMRLGAF